MHFLWQGDDKPGAIGGCGDGQNLDVLNRSAKWRFQKTVKPSFEFISSGYHGCECYTCFESSIVGRKCSSTPLVSFERTVCSSWMAVVWAGPSGESPLPLLDGSLFRRSGD